MTYQGKDIVKDITWRHVIVIVAFLAALCALSITGHDTGAFVAIGAAILAAMGLIATNTATVKNQVNGNSTEMLAMLREMSQQLARMIPPPEPKQDAAETRDLGE